MSNCERLMSPILKKHLYLLFICILIEIIVVVLITVKLYDPDSQNSKSNTFYNKLLVQVCNFQFIELKVAYMQVSECRWTKECLLIGHCTSAEMIISLASDFFNIRL